jgi:dihydroneopterin aldolase
MGIIRLNNIRVYAFHGCMDEEGRIGSDYLVNLELRADLSTAAQQDDLSETIDYVAVNRIVQSEMAIRSKLIEAVAQRIAQKIKAEFPMLTGGNVEVVKLSPPMGGHVDSVSVVLEL